MPWYWWLLTIVGFAGLAWLLVVTLFTPAINYHLIQRVAAESPQFFRALHAICQAEPHTHNKVDVLTNGPTFYPAMM